MRAIRVLFLAGLLFFCASSLAATTIHVPADQPTIQAGIDAAVEGDTVLVADGIYTGEGNRDIDFGGKAIIVTSANGPDNCVIDCEREGRGFYFHSGEGLNSVLHGFTIRDGWEYYDHGGGIYCVSSSPTIINNVITNNIVSGNPANGGGIACYYNPAPKIINNLIENNGARSGGGIYSWECDTSIKENIISENVSVEWGGGIFIEFCSPLLERNLICGNFSKMAGGIHYAHNTGSIVNCTITRNFVLWEVGGGINVADSDLSIVNCIIWENFPEQIYYPDWEPEVSYCDVDGGWEGEGNIDDNPHFVDPDNDDFHLLSDSPCIDAGDPESQLDPDSTRADIGVYFFDQGPVSVFVEPDTTIYHRGDLLGFTVTLMNRADSTVSFEGWTEVETAWGWFVSPLLGPINIILNPFQTISRHVTQQIPENTPLGGPYLYSALVGTYPDEVLFEDLFELYVIPGIPEKGPRERVYADWEVIESELW